MSQSVTGVEMSMARAPGRGVTVMVASSLVTRIDPGATRLVVVVDGREISTLLKVGEQIAVGSDEGVGLCIPDPTVSRAHVRITGALAGIRVEDLSSTNGTFYEGAQVRDVTVPLGATLKLGNAELRVRPVESEVPSTTPAAPFGAAKGTVRAPSAFGSLVAGDDRMRDLFAHLRDIAPLTASVIIEGETGTGKELVARALHDASPRANKPFVVFDCTAVPKDLIESALFGHVRGAFTGATGTRLGAFRRAHGGTIFLDEMGELPLDLQPKLLRVLESRTVQAVGDDEPEKIDVRVVCATHRELKAEVRAGRFREDLYYRLAVVKVRLPALRERPDDVEPLVRHFARALSEGRPVPELTGFAALREHPFPGNVRELRNLVERALSLSKGGPVDLGAFLPAADDRAPAPASAAAATLHDGAEPLGAVDDIRVIAADALSGIHSFKDAKALVVDAFERAFLETLVQKAGNLSRAAAAAQMDRKHLRELLKRHGLRVGPEAPEADE